MMDEYVWSMDILEGSTLESKKEDHVDEHQSYILEEPQDSCFHEKSLESIVPFAVSTYESCNHLMFSFIKPSKGLLWMLLFTISIPMLIVVLALVLATETAKVKLYDLKQSTTGR
jgi:hypothetical protein